MIRTASAERPADSQRRCLLKSLTGELDEKNDDIDYLPLRIELNGADVRGSFPPTILSRAQDRTRASTAGKSPANERIYYYQKAKRDTHELRLAPVSYLPLARFTWANL
jgi:hypothetical protein